MSNTTTVNPLADPTGMLVAAIDAAIAAATDAALIQKLQDAKAAIGLMNAQMQSTASARAQLQRDLDAANISLANGGVANVYANKVIADATQRLQNAKTKVNEANAQVAAMQQAMPPPDQTFVTVGAAAGFTVAGLILGGMTGYFGRGMLDRRAEKKAALGAAGEPAALPAETETVYEPEEPAAAAAAPRRKKKRVVRAAAAAEE